MAKQLHCYKKQEPCFFSWGKSIHKYSLNVSNKWQNSTRNLLTLLFHIIHAYFWANFASSILSELIKIEASLLMLHLFLYYTPPKRCLMRVPFTACDKALEPPLHKPTSLKQALNTPHKWAIAFILFAWRFCIYMDLLICFKKKYFCK